MSDPELQSTTDVNEPNNEGSSDRLAVVGVELSQKAAELEQTEGPQANQILREVQSVLVNTDDPNRFNVAQRRLEAANTWTTGQRLLAVGINRANWELNRADLELKDERPVTFDEVMDRLSPNDADYGNISELSPEDRQRVYARLGAIHILRSEDRPVSMKVGAIDLITEQIENDLADAEQRLGPHAEAIALSRRFNRDALVLKRTELTAAIPPEQTAV